MNTIQVCRTCMAHDTRIYTIANTPLQEFYERTTNKPFDIKDGRPTVVCYICYHLMKKCLRFTENAIKVDEVLQDICKSGIKMTEQFLSKIHKPSIFMALKKPPVTHVNVTKDISAGVEKYEVKNEYDHLLDIDEMDYEQGRMAVGATEVPEEINSAKQFEVKQETELSLEDTLQSQDHHSWDSDDDTPLNFRIGNHEGVEKESIPETSGHRNNGAPGPKKRKNVKSPERLEVQSSKQKTVGVKIYTSINQRKIKHTHKDKGNKKLKLKKSNQSNKPVNDMEAKKPILNPNESSTRENVKTAVEEPITCTYCEKLFSNKSNLSRHMKLHKGEKFTCDYCQKKFKGKQYLISHLRIHSGEQPYTCSFCEKKFSDQSNYTRHLRYHKRDKPFICNECGKEFIVKHRLISHLRTHFSLHMVKTQMCTNLVTCSVCGKKLSDERSLTRHLKIHKDEKPFTCDDCGRKFKEKHSLTRHLSVHVVEKSFICHHCGKKFTEELDLTRHLLSIPMAVKPPKCSVCGKIFANERSLSRHLNLHKGEKPYTCNHCGKKFIEKHHLKSHLKRIHNVEKPACSICKKTFKDEITLSSHLKSHKSENKFTCNNCGKMYKEKRSLKLHLRRVHMDKKSFKCEYCGKMFTEENDLTSHMRHTHMVKKSFTCNNCGKKFRGKRCFQCNDQALQ